MTRRNKLDENLSLKELEVKIQFICEEIHEIYLEINSHPYERKKYECRLKELRQLLEKYENYYSSKYN